LNCGNNIDTNSHILAHLQIPKPYRVDSIIFHDSLGLEMSIKTLRV